MTGSALFFPGDLPLPRDCGGKAGGLLRLQNLGFSVPTWFLVRPDAPCRGAWPRARLTPEVRAQIVRGLHRLGGSRFAVRSSGAAEDGAGQSYAGQFDSLLDVAPEAVCAAVERVRGSASGARVAAYRRAVGQEDGPAACAVVVQRMLRPALSGIAFTADPGSGDRGTCVIAVVRGSGEELAAGRSDGETCRVSLDGQVTRDRTREAPLLPAGQARAIAGLCREAALAAGCPQDVEWAIEQGRLFLLQARPITGLPEGPQGRAILWDNSNIVESFGGVVSPLTFSFAHRVYGAVYPQIARLVGVAERDIAGNAEAFRNMIGQVEGRIYYNLLNWYRILTLFPAYGFLKASMEEMMGVDRALLSQVEGPQRRGPAGRIGTAFRLARVGAGLLVQRLRLGRSRRRFHAEVEAALRKARLLEGGLDLAGAAAVYRRLERDLLGRWTAPLVNDLFCMIAVGALGRLLARALGERAPRFQAQLLAGEKDILSTEPARLIAELGAMARRRPALLKALQDGPTERAQEAIAADPEMGPAFSAYLARFGERCAAELKLESPSLQEDPRLLLDAIAQAATGPARDSAPEAGPGDELDKALAGRPLLRLAVRLLAREARRRIRDRENMRFERTRVFGLVRRLALAMGRDLAACGRLAHEREVFYLTIDELLAMAEAGSITGDPGALAALRRAEFERLALRPQPPRRFLTRGAVSLAEIEPCPTESPDGEEVQPGQRRGVGGCAGTVRGRARVVLDPRGVTVRPGEILVAPFTDPGWVLLFVNAAGLVVERGSLLSHSAIVARELGLPSVLGLADATRWIEEGALIEVDGTSGLVRKVAAP